MGGRSAWNITGEGKNQIKPQRRKEREEKRIQTRYITKRVCHCERSLRSNLQDTFGVHSAIRNLQSEIPMHLHLSGHLNWYDLQKRARIEIHLPEPIRLIDLLEQLGVPPAEIAIVAVNGNAADLEDAFVSDADRVDLYPPIGGGETSNGVEGQPRCPQTPSTAGLLTRGGERATHS